MARLPLLPLCIGYILAETASFIVVGNAAGMLPTLGLVLAGMLGGALLLRWTGFATLMRIRTEVAAKRLPARPLLDGAVFALAALLLIVPGFVSDLVALVLLIPLTRAALYNRLSRSIALHRANSPLRGQTRAPVIELDRHDYVAAAPKDSPWRREGP